MAHLLLSLRHGPLVFVGAEGTQLVLHCNEGECLGQARDCLELRVRVVGRSTVIPR